MSFKKLAVCAASITAPYNPCTLKIVGRILTIDRAGRTNDACDELGAVAGTGPYVEHFHAGHQPSKGKERHRIAPFVGRAIGIAAVWRRHERRIVRRRLRERAGNTETANAHSEEYGSTDNGSTTQPDHFVLLGFVSNHFEA
jgi:hypothetical protein